MTEIMRETVAKHIYEAMAWACANNTGDLAPPWVENGNSYAQTEARISADRILAVLSGWRSMASAPKDGTPIDLWVINDTGGERYTDMVYYAGDQDNDWEDIHGMFSIVGDGLMRMDQVVAWMPIPMGYVTDGDDK